MNDMLIFTLAAFAILQDARPQEETPYLQTCLAAAADESAVYPTDRLPAAPEAVAVFRLGPGEAFDKITFAWIAVDVGEAAPPNYEIAKADLPLRGQRKGVLRLTGLQQPMPVGRYRLDVQAGGKTWKSKAFEVVEPAAAPKIEKPEDLLPLVPGQTWKYALTLEAGEGATARLGEAKAGADGKIRAAVTMKIAARDDDGARAELHRDGALVFEEWFRLDRKGFASLRRKSVGEEAFVLDPPQVLWPLPLSTPKAWNYRSADKSIQQTYRMWGPVPVAVPQGEAPGYVVLVEEPHDKAKITVERHFVPGVGLAREVIIQALSGRLLSRQEMVLRP